MTSVNITTTQNTVAVTEGDPTILTVATQGPQGPQGPTGPTGPTGPASLLLTDSAKINRSLIYYDAASNSYKADETVTTSTLTDGGNF